MLRARRIGVSPAALHSDNLNEIDNYTMQYHHGDDPADAMPHAIDPIEVKGFAKRTLKIVEGYQG